MAHQDELQSTHQIERFATIWRITERGMDGSIWGIYELPNDAFSLHAWLEQIMFVTEPND